MILSLLVFTYRFFLYRFPQLCILAVAEDSEEPIGKGITRIYMQRAHTNTFLHLCHHERRNEFLQGKTMIVCCDNTHAVVCCIVTLFPHMLLSQYIYILLYYIYIGCVVGKMDREDHQRHEEEDEEEAEQEEVDETGEQEEPPFEDESISKQQEDHNNNNNNKDVVEKQDTIDDDDDDDDDNNKKEPVVVVANNNDNVNDGGEWTGYIGMLAVRESYRRRGIGKALVRLVLQRMKDLHCTSATLETEVTNTTAQKLYQECFGFIREELLVRYYLNWNDAYRLRLWFDNQNNDNDPNGNTTTTTTTKKDEELGSTTTQVSQRPPPSLEGETRTIKATA